MSDPDTNPLHDLVDDPQDQPQPSIRLGTFLALMRLIAGRRGHSRVVWNRYGFTYLVIVVRENGLPTVLLDDDPDAIGLPEALQALHDALD